MSVHMCMTQSMVERGAHLASSKKNVFGDHELYLRPNISIITKEDFYH